MGAAPKPESVCGKTLSRAPCPAEAPGRTLPVFAHRAGDEDLSGKEKTMNREIERQKQLMESSGLGLLPGLGLAFALCILIMGALVLDTWWVVPVVLVSLFVVTGIVAWIVFTLIRVDGGSPEH